MPARIMADHGHDPGRHLFGILGGLVIWAGLYLLLPMAGLA